MPVTIDEYQYFLRIGEFIKTVSVADLKLYLAFVMVHSRIDWLDEEFYHLYESYKANKVPPEVVESYYYKKACDKQREKPIQEMIEFVKASLRLRFTEAQWLTDADKLLHVMQLQDTTII